MKTVIDKSSAQLFKTLKISDDQKNTESLYYKHYASNMKLWNCLNKSESMERVADGIVCTFVGNLFGFWLPNLDHWMTPPLIRYFCSFEPFSFYALFFFAVELNKNKSQSLIVYQTLFLRNKTKIVHNIHEFFVLPFRFLKIVLKHCFSSWRSVLVFIIVLEFLHGANESVSVCFCICSGFLYTVCTECYFSCD